jgi:type IV pilus assembly protein PilV
MLLPSNRDGFTLVEVLVAMVIMTVGLLGLLQSLNIAVEHNLRNYLREQAVTLGENQMNLFRNHTSLAFSNYTNAVVLIRGGVRHFDVYRSSSPTSDVTRELQVRVVWLFKNISTQHMVKSLITRPN